MRILFFFVLLLTAALYTPCHAGDYGLSSVSAFSDWEPTDCFKPYPPSFYISDTNSYNIAVDEYNNYIAEVENYLLCIQNEGQRDMQTMLESVKEGVKSAENDILNEVRRVKNDLESHRMLLN